MRVLYICTGNSFRSPAAEALTRKYHPDWQVESAGTGPAGHVSHNARALLRGEEAEQFVKSTPKPIAQRALDEADVVVCMKPRHRDHLLEHFDADSSILRIWNVEDPLHSPISPEDAFGQIKQRVRDLEEER